MGYIDPVCFLGGEMPIDTSLAQSGIKSKVCKPLKMDFESGASGILKVALRLTSHIPGSNLLS